MDLEAALGACDAADAASELFYLKIADQSTVSRSTLSWRHQPVCTLREEGYSSQRKISP
ncbi:uncharacterized protein M421DRAFT_68074 [Didymella exigua CBS 183.55]|uniref:Uncharacterized protein n=1 Tax=Didymella exigua CBS 183.55 TaxID=1150837 RepID=A0A6A5RGM0_9PLEO|nr:uncharacterized protein M421DRAFT_68074 [Didymella exigua CBS 183.55]KAF1926234.1 hypothetical protein M421DRAFT_68074 [Didymella exigua CBS 183.55]